MKLQAIPPKLRFVDNNGIALAGGKVYTYDGGTTTPKATYTDYDGATPNANPVILDSRGEAGIWLSEGLYKFVVKDSAETTIYTVDDLSNDPVSSTTDFAASTGAALVGRIDSATGAVSETVQTVLRRRVHIDSFNPPADPTADAKDALTAFINSAIARPGVKHYLGNRVYCTSDELPDITVSNVKIYGAGASKHDAGSSVLTGSVIKAIGSGWSGKKILTVQSVSGASNAHISDIDIIGVCFDCNELADSGLVVNSVFDGHFKVAAIEATVTAVDVGVVAELGEARDTQRCHFDLVLRQTLTGSEGHYGLRLTGDTVANVSLNNFYIEAQHADVAAVFAGGSDTNTWDMRTSRIPGGTATEGASFIGGASDAESARYERVEYYSGTVGVHVYGTSGSPSYAFPAHDISIIELDKGNGTPDPTVEGGATCYWENNNTPFGSTPWVAATPTPTAGSGTFTSVSCARRVLTRGRIAHVDILVTITTNGTAATNVSVPLGFTAGAAGAWVLPGREIAVAGKMLQGYIGPGGTTVTITNYDATYPGSSGAILALSGFVEIA